MQVRDVYETVITEQYHRVRKATSDYKVVREFLEYLEKVWIGGGGGVGKKPTFPIIWWNHYQTILTGRARTNNSSEGFNSSWTRSLPQHASFYTILGTFRDVSKKTKGQCHKIFHCVFWV